ncbi:MAG: slipin family protein [Oscillospiraceae bacterium]|nr:slipin family protein [Oscillospiraceae bacterium]
MKVIINNNQKGLLFKNGILVDFLGAGKYRAGGSKTIEILPLDEEISSNSATLAQILTKVIDRYKSDDLTSEVTVKNGEVALHYVDGVFIEALTAGRHAFWKEAGAHEFKIYSTTEPKITDIPAAVAARLGAGFVLDVNIPAECKAIVYYDGKPAEYLDAGRYFYWNGAVKVTTATYSMRVQQLDINGQEILTKDKVGVRVNFTANWKITDHKKLAEAYPNITQTLYTAAQLALRDYLGGKTMDELLADRENIGNEILAELKKRTADMFVEIISAGIKDVILPGEISAIMNSVLAAEKRAQANVITRREEVASTRSLLNTAKLMDENATLRRLKELEYIEKICENVGEITVDARSSLLSQLANIIGNNSSQE